MKKVNKTDLTRSKNIDLAYQKMVKIADKLEPKLGERTNVETKHEGRTNFEYEVLFCNSKNKVTKKIIKVKLSK